ncbi:MAG: hypothetical protein FK734_12845 [Asgard group archaeon]|nr:hypothetical protein [Asgard group archaeon]
MSETDLSGDFTDIEDLLNTLDIDLFPEQVGIVIDEIKDSLASISDQLDGFEEFITFTSNNIQPTKYILWTTYNSLVGNEYLRDYRFTDAKWMFNQAINTITLIDLTAPTDIGLTGVFAFDISEDYYALLGDLVDMMTPLLFEEREYATTYEKIDTIMAHFATQTDITTVDYITNIAPLVNGSNTEAYGIDAQLELDSFRANLIANAYGNMFTDVGKSINKTLTKDFKPSEFGTITNQMAQIVSFFMVSCQEYSIQNFGEARTNIMNAELIMNSSLILLIDPSDPAYLQNYMNNWSIALSSIRFAMTTYDDIPVFDDGLNAIQLVILDLYPKIEEK